jgi:hypothetical protein
MRLKMENFFPGEARGNIFLKEILFLKAWILLHGTSF